MSVWRKLTLLLPWKRRAEDRDMQEELAALRDIAGARELGNLTLAAEDARAAQSWLGLERLVQDVRYALRSMTHHKAFTALVVLSLALGIGANTAIYSFAEAILLRPLPVNEPDQLVIMKWRAKGYSLARNGMSWSTGGTVTSTTEGGRTTLATNFPYAALDVFAGAKDVLSHAYAYFAIARIGVTVGDHTDALRGQYVSGDYFAGMGVVPVAGRLVQPADDAAGTAVAVVSERFSQRRFGTPGAAVGQTIRLNDKPFQVIGVAPSNFFGAEPGAIPDIFLPMRADAILEPQFASWRYSDSYYFWSEIMGRLKPGVTLEQAQAALAPRFHQYMSALATEEKERADIPVLALESGSAGLDTLRRRYALPIYVLLAMVGLMLLVACANAANLLLARATARRREIAVRLSIGASRGRVIRQLLTESLVLALAAGSLGLLLAWWGIDVLTALLATGRENFTLHAELNPVVLAMTIGVSAVTGLLFGLAPALQATRVDVAPALKESRVNPSTRRGGFRPSHALVIAQVVFSLMLLVGAGLFGRTVWRLHAIETGFDRDNVLLFTIRPAAIGYRGEALVQLYERLRLELTGLAGVVAVTNSGSPLPMGGGTMGPVAIDGAPPPPIVDGRPATAVFASVGPAFFTTMRMPIGGRDLSDRDAAGAPKVVVVNRRLGRLFGIEQPVGRTLIVGKERYEIVGVTEDALTFDLKGEARPAVYFPHLQEARPLPSLTFEVRTAGAPMAFASTAREAVRRVDARLAIHDMKSQATHIDQGISTEITLARLCAAFAGLALVIACVGLYGTVAFNVARRTNEIGIRVTLGAQRGRIVWMILRDVLMLTAAGLAIGVPLALAGSGYVRSLLYGIEPTDPVVLAAGVVALISCGLAAGFVPARRAARIDPMIAVRHE